MAAPWLIVAGDLTPLGGMDAANHALARYLATHDREVHVVAHRVWDDLIAMPSLSWHRVWRPGGRHLFGAPLLARAGQRTWQRLRPRGARALVNGGNCHLAGASWVHYVHAAYAPQIAGSASQRAKARWLHQRNVAAERDALRSATVVLCNSQRTARDVIDRVGVPAARVSVVYLGTDPDRFSPVEAGERAAARSVLGRRDDRPLIGFVGALGDRRKAFDTVFSAWVALCRRTDWDADLIVVGAGAELEAWKTRAAEAGLADRMAFLGFRADVPRVLAALDALVHPARYEAYGLSVHEAICRGLPTLVSASAGVAELYSSALDDLLIDNPDDPEELAARLQRWRTSVDRHALATRELGARLRARTWDVMAEEIATIVERAT